jgi:hypothetical protein
VFCDWFIFMAVLVEPMALSRGIWTATVGSRKGSCVVSYDDWAHD